ncbi:MAG: hypothetical protein GY940_16550 [bacterium]|nr:hypothetical protein [bacterium]
MKLSSHHQSGKIRFSSILIVLAIIYGAFVAVKIIATNVMPGQIRVDITDRIGILRGPSFTVEDGIKIVKDVLRENGVLESEYDDADEGVAHDDTETSAGRQYLNQRIDVRLNEKTTMVEFSLTYEYETNFLFFKQKKTYEVKGEVQNYN